MEEQAVERKYSNKHHTFKPKKNINLLRNEEIENLNQKISELNESDVKEFDSFAKLPISSHTLTGLKENKFLVPTKVQRETLIHSLQGLDVVAAAKTGSGKTLAFMIPLLEELHRNKWSIADGLGAIVITPTRELAYQIYELLKKVGIHHNFSSALVIGGKDWKYEKYAVGRCNILICTPGRLLHHITTYTNFDCSNVKVLVLDEADMCLSLGFSNHMNAIFDELPKERKTWLFSATQTREIKDLIRAGCKSPIFCSVHENSKSSTPKSLTESYVVCDVEDKINFLWSFLKHRKKSKTLVFLATCKQVRYINSVFRQLRPGVPVLNIHGGMHQLRRMAVYDEFCRKKFAVLFATDVAARGLDIPSVDWVVQYDCPEDVTSYIHRAGRTARYSQSGEALLMVTSSEEQSIISKLKKNNIPIEKIAADPRKLQDIQRSLANITVKHNHIFQEAQRAFKAYIKNICLMSDKDTFDPTTINTDAFAQSLGLEITPRVRFLERKIKSSSKSNKANTQVVEFGDYHDDDDDDAEDFLVSNPNKLDLVLPEIEDENIDVLSESLISSNLKKNKVITKAALAKKLIKRNVQLNSKVEFNDEGDVIIDHYKQKSSHQIQNNNNSIDITALQKAMKEVDKLDKRMYADKRKDKRRQEKSKLKEARKAKDKSTVDLEEDSDVEEDTQDIIDSLPDPDKLYGASNSDDSGQDFRNSDNEETNSDDDDENSSDSDDGEHKKISGKRLAKQKMKDAKRAKLCQSNNIEALPVSEQEQLALYLLQNR